VLKNDNYDLLIIIYTYTFMLQMIIMIC